MTLDAAVEGSSWSVIDKELELVAFRHARIARRRKVCIAERADPNSHRGMRDNVITLPESESRKSCAGLHTERVHEDR